MVSPGSALMEGSSLRVNCVSKRFLSPDRSEFTALDSVSLSVTPGQLISLIGPSGCGKSTLLRMIAGLESPDAGELLVGKEKITGPSANRGLVFQDPNLFPWLTVRGNIQTVHCVRCVQIPGRSGRYGRVGRM